MNKQITTTLTPEMWKAIRFFKENQGLQSMAAAQRELIVRGLNQAGITVHNPDPRWGGHRWDGDTRPLSER